MGNAEEIDRINPTGLDLDKERFTVLNKIITWTKSYNTQAYEKVSETNFLSKKKYYLEFRNY